jgi:hypothetical protein
MNRLRPAPATPRTEADDILRFARASFDRCEDLHAKIARLDRGLVLSPRSPKRGLLRTRRRKVATFSTVAVLVLAGGAFALWTVTADGPGRSKAGSIVAPTVTLADAPGAVPVDLFPSATPTGSVGYIINNTNAAPIKLTGVAQNGTVSNDANCSGTLVTLPTQTGLSIPIAVGIFPYVIPNAVRLDPTAPVGCMGITFDIPSRLTFGP